MLMSRKRKWQFLNKIHRKDVSVLLVLNKIFKIKMNPLKYLTFVFRVHIMQLRKYLINPLL